MFSAIYCLNIRYMKISSHCSQSCWVRKHSFHRTSSSTRPGRSARPRRCKHSSQALGSIPETKATASTMDPPSSGISGNAWDVRNIRVQKILHRGPNSLENWEIVDSLHGKLRIAFFAPILWIDDRTICLQWGGTNDCGSCRISIQTKQISCLKSRDKMDLAPTSKAGAENLASFQQSESVDGALTWKRTATSVARAPKPRGHEGPHLQEQFGSPNLKVLIASSKQNSLRASFMGRKAVLSCTKLTMLPS